MMASDHKRIRFTSQHGAKNCCGGSKFVDFCQLLETVEEPFKTPADKLRPAYNLKETGLAKLYAMSLSLPSAEIAKLKHYKDPAMLEGSKARAGDFGSVLHSVLLCRMESRPSVLTLDEANRFLDEIHAAVDMTDKKTPLCHFIRKTSPMEQKWVARIILKDMRIGIGHERILKELHSDAIHLYNQCSDLKVVLHTLCDIAINQQQTEGTRSLRDSKSGVVSKEDGIWGETSRCGGTTPRTANTSVYVDMFRAVRPMLAERVHATEVEKLFQKNTEYLIEKKYDGERIICHVDKVANKVEFFSRRAKSYSAKYGPQMNKIVLDAVSGEQVMLDGEMLAWDATTNRFVAFGSNRTVAGNCPTSGRHLCYVVFDILYYKGPAAEGVDMTQSTLMNRKHLLKHVVVEDPHKLEVAPYRATRAAADVLEALRQTFRRREEGLVLKNVCSVYKPNARKSGGWFKLKPEHGALSDTLDLLVVGGYFGDGRRRRDHASKDDVDHVSRFLLGVLDRADTPESLLLDNGDDSNIKIVTVGKVGTGYTNEELRQIRDIIRPHCFRNDDPLCAPWLIQNKLGVVSDRPDIVWPPSKSFVMEVKAAEFVKSTAFSFGWTLRFPTVVRPLRPDLSWSDAWNVDTLTEFRDKSLQASQGTDQPPRHFTSPEADSDSEGKGSESEAANGPIVDVPTLMPQRKRIRRGRAGPPHSNPGPQLLEAFRQIDTTDLTVKFGVFCNTEILVIESAREGQEGLRKADLERCVVEFGGHITQAFRKGFTTHVVATGDSFRTRKIVEMHGVPVLRGTWLIACVKAQMLLPLCPRYVFNCGPDLEARFSEEFSSYGCSFFQPSDTEELREIICGSTFPLDKLLAHPDIHEVRQLYVDSGALEMVTNCSGIRLYIGDTTCLTTVFGLNAAEAAQTKEAIGPNGVACCLMTERLRHLPDKEMETVIESSTEIRDQSTLLHFQMHGGRLSNVLDEATHILCTGQEQRVMTAVSDGGAKDWVTVYAKHPSGRRLPWVTCSWLRSRMEDSQKVL
eukprot:GHVS01104812.1.p1 GENE.GHVS01104812.1~~GHVS01104812.1.p1  ORF type:complete len:1025 (-),score=77.63 GHVS01104812.1:2533-5607(-)